MSVLQRPSVDTLYEGVVQGDRALIGRALTLVESNHPRHQARATELLQRLLPHAGEAVRVGITGVPGVGKSTFVEALGMRLIAAGQQIAVLAVDPTSSVSGGSILGDKTRMVDLAAHEAAFVRPSPAGGSLGGVARKTRESMVVLEAAGYDTILVETVGVGQSEVQVAGMVDTFLVLMLAGAGDELQGIKRGVLELADVVAVNKADGDNVIRAGLAAASYERALHYVRHRLPGWTPPVIQLSALEDRGVDTLWAAVISHREALTSAGLAAMRARQRRVWMWQLVDEAVREAVRAHPDVVTVEREVSRDVEQETTTAADAARQILAAFGL